MRRTSKVIMSAVILIVSYFLFRYCLFTYPRIVLGFPIKVSGATKTEREFDIPWGHQYLQVEIVIREGRTLWSAKITFGNETVWDGSGATLQTGQTTYTSSWVTVASGHYKFTIGTLGSFDGDVKISTKGGFW